MCVCVDAHYEYRERLNKFPASHITILVTVTESFSDNTRTDNHIFTSKQGGTRCPYLPLPSMAQKGGMTLPAKNEIQV